MTDTGHLVIRTEAEAQRDHAHTWMWGFVCGAAFAVSSFVLWRFLV